MQTLDANHGKHNIQDVIESFDKLEHLYLELIHGNIEHNDVKDIPAMIDKTSSLFTSICQVVPVKDFEDRII